MNRMNPSHPCPSAAPSNAMYAAGAMHQYYRDTLSQDFSFPAIGGISKDVIMHLVQTGSCDVTRLLDHLLSTPSGLEENQDKALKMLLVLICQANMALDKNNNGIQQKFPPSYAKALWEGLMKVLTLDPNDHYLTIAAQLLFRVGDIQTVLDIARQRPIIAEKHRTFQKILAMIHMMDKDYEKALPYLADLIENKLESQNSLVTLMAMSCMYKLGGLPETPMDFSTLAAEEEAAQASSTAIDWFIEPEPSRQAKPVVLIACDERYFFDHALALIYSLQETNSAEMDVHLHLYNPNPSVLWKSQQLNQALPELHITATQERIRTDAAKIRVDFASRRFVAASQVLQRLNAPLIVVDADGLFRKSWTTWLGNVDLTADIIYGSSNAVPFWEEVPAGFVYLKNSTAASGYIRQVARFIENNLEKNNHVWFLDQMALSACMDQVSGDAAQIWAPPASTLVDINHTADSLYWAVTTMKSGASRYDEYKKYLLEKYEGIYLGKLEDIFHYLSKSKETVRFVQVGAMDGVSYDPIHKYVKNFGWQGILIEPLPDMMQSLKSSYRDCKGLIFENIAISDKKETKTLYRVEPEVIKKHQLPDWLKGMSTFVDGKLDNYRQYVKKQPVQCYPLMSVLEKHRLPCIDVLQIDTEGFDYKVFKQLDFSKYRPSAINIEVVNLEAEEFDLLQSELLNQGYVFYRYEMDMIAVHTSLYKQAQKEA